MSVMNQFLTNQTESYLCYDVKANDMLSKIEYKVMANYTEDGLVPCYLITYNNNVRLVYDISQYKALNSEINSFTKRQLLVLINKFYLLTELIQKNGFLDSNHIDFNEERIFYERDSEKLYIIYLPIRLTENIYHTTLENKIRDILSRAVITISNGKDSGLQLLLNNLKDKNMTFDEIYIKNNTGTYGDLKKEIQLNKVEDITIKKLYTLHSKGEAWLTKIDITKKEFYIGKKEELVDGVIAGHATISRRHCMISISESQVYITDLDSANGTYINGVKLPSSKRYPINVGDEIRLADVVFELKEEVL